MCCYVKLYDLHCMIQMNIFYIVTIQTSPTNQTLRQRYCFIIVFAVQINKVCLQVTVEAVIGGSVVRPCSSAESKLELKEMFVFWRDKDNRIIYDLNEGTDSLKSQDPRYKNRVQTFPDEYKRGNFSIKLINLTHTDAGQFNFYITPSDEQETVQLIIKESTNNKKTVGQKHN
ncbi:CD276 antigen-like protein [Labeo rohita]|uniref:CD276 antigen-like protein n=1 Tax=Labeo rohita TaxID=84645 RepID=A0A498NUH1_LABRO|nr:CD276 antigen-like protein [Labeo rohita]